MQQQSRGEEYYPGEGHFTIAGRMGLLGLLAFFGVVGTVFGYALRHRRALRADEGRDAVWLGLHAALVGALVAGVFDHYLFNMDFHHAVTIFWMVLGIPRIKVMRN